MRYIVILTCLLASVGIVWALCPFNSTADGALTIISILATLIVGISVVNSLEVAALKDKILEIEKIRKRTEQISKRTSVLFHITNGNIYLKDNPLKAISHYLSGFIIASEHEEPDYAEEALSRAEIACAKFMKSNQKASLILSGLKPKLDEMSNLKGKKGFRPFKKRVKVLTDIFLKKY